MPMQDIWIWASILVGVGLVLLAAELILPTHGVLGVLGAAALLGALGLSFLIHRWLGVVLSVAALVSSPFLWNLAVNLWQKTPVGRRVVLSATVPEVDKALPPLGAEGVAVSEMRPMGECEFGDARVEATSEFGIIAAGQRVRVIGVEPGGVVRVRRIETT